MKKIIFGSKETLHLGA